MVTAAEVRCTVTAMLAYLEAAGWESYDYTDWWATSWGVRLKQWAYRTEPVGNLLFAAPLLALELWLPGARKLLGIRKRVYPICIAQHGLACLALHRYSGDTTWLAKAQADADHLAATTIPGTAGLCFGF